MRKDNERENRGSLWSSVWNRPHVDGNPFGDTTDISSCQHVPCPGSPTVSAPKSSVTKVLSYKFYIDLSIPKSKV